jgi:type I restriction enzyme M protein
MVPYLEEVEKQKANTVILKEKLAALKKSKAADKTISDCREELATVEKAAREAQAKADAIDAATYDLKAVNPNAKTETDGRTPVEIIEIIEAHGRKVEQALAKLRKLIQ